MNSKYFVIIESYLNVLFSNLIDIDKYMLGTRDDYIYYGYLCAYVLVVRKSEAKTTQSTHGIYSLLWRNTMHVYYINFEIKLTKRFEKINPKQPQIE